MLTPELEVLVADANSLLDHTDRSRIIGETDSTPPRFELYHYGLSICSQKVRAVLHEKNIPYLSHEILISPPHWDNYKPEFVRLRMKAGEEFLGKMVHGFTGSTSTDLVGFDPCAVPVFVDHERGKLVADSKRICSYINDLVGSSIDLLPDPVADSVVEQVAIVDQLPDHRYTIP